MKDLKDKDGNVITLEKLEKIFLKYINESANDSLGTYISCVEQLSKEYNVNKETPVIGDVATICAVQGNLLYIIKMVLCELLGIEDTSSTGTEDIQTVQSKK